MTTELAASGPPLSAVMVYVTLLPFAGVEFETDFDKVTSATAVGRMEADAICVPVRSGLVCVSVAVLTIVPLPSFTSAVNVAVADDPCASVPTFQVRVGTP